MEKFNVWNGKIKGEGGSDLFLKKSYQFEKIFSSRGDFEPPSLLHPCFNHQQFKFISSKL